MREFKIMSVNKTLGRHEAWPKHTKSSRQSSFAMSIESREISNLQDEEPHRGKNWPSSSLSPQEQKTRCSG